MSENIGEIGVQLCHRDRLIYFASELPLFKNIVFLNLWLLCVVAVLQEDQGIYQNKVRDLISDNQYRLIVNVNDLRRKNEKRANR